MKKVYTKINKTKARTLFNKGKSFLIVPSKVNPENSFGIGYVVDPIECDINDTSLQDLLLKFCYYNCCNELGYSIAFYRID